MLPLHGSIDCCACAYHSASCPVQLLASMMQLCRTARENALPIVQDCLPALSIPDLDAMQEMLHLTFFLQGVPLRIGFAQDHTGLHLKLMRDLYKRRDMTCRVLGGSWILLQTPKRALLLAEVAQMQKARSLWRLTCPLPALRLLAANNCLLHLSGLAAVCLMACG